MEKEYYKYVANWIRLTYEEQCEIPLLDFNSWKKKKGGTK